ncbi:nucleotidyltransferase family protein [Chloroflexus sp.]|uniref:nucleotidyltransferase family protein n=1 Tax=Chloroflexus sp. TaxID=1904827 RepID=UPI00298F0C82|nr:sugar phosphate nucleotidyltransferase [Chloroflexus sp.]MCS6887836.1 sugar phosphate nucleotidyltransferase [Chloroflexus sp.]MDW8405076.1 sugar phosphate nucleotidyltransferase [Chloroflexus sp.]
MIGLIPAGGIAARLGPLPCSKELLPAGAYVTPDGLRPRPVITYLLAQWQRAGIERALVVLRPGKWDIPAYLGDGRAFGPHIAYLIVHEPHGAAYTLAAALPFLAGQTVALGLPDVILAPDDVYTTLASHHATRQPDLTLGLFPCQQPHTADMVALSGDSRRVTAIEIKPAQTSLQWTWMAAIWSPAVTRVLAEVVDADRVARQSEPSRPELHIGTVFQAAIEQGLRVEGVTFPSGHALDIGTPAGWAASRGRML